jgi:hypothetical protein
MGILADNGLEDDIVNSNEAYLCLADDAPGLATPESMVFPRLQSFTPVLSTCAGDQWRLVSEGIFTHALPSGANPPDETGLRIRLYVYPALADDVLWSIVPIIVGAGCPFKVIANTALLELVCSRNSTGHAGADFMTIYPPGEELFNELTAKLREATTAIKNSFIPAPPPDSSRGALTSENPWPGLDVFLPGESAFFCAREEEQRGLAQCLERGPVTVLLGQPGVGKSSLLRAGLAAAFERMRLVPVYLRLQSGGGAHPLQQVRDQVNRVLRERQIEGAPFGEGQSLREYFNQTEAGWVAADKNPVMPILIFDQFEDVFPLNDADPAGGKQLEVFWNQLANLLENRARETIGQFKRSSTSERLGCKVVIGLRQEHLPQLLGHGGQIPSVSRNHFSLKVFNGLKAVEAVLGAGRHLLDPGMADLLAEEIVRRVARETSAPAENASIGAGDVKPLDQLRVEPALLSFFCQQLDEARKHIQELGAEGRIITAKLVEAKADPIFAAFFVRKGMARPLAQTAKIALVEPAELQLAKEQALLAPVAPTQPTEPPLTVTEDKTLVAAVVTLPEAELARALSQAPVTVESLATAHAESPVNVPEPSHEELRPAPTQPQITDLDQQHESAEAMVSAPISEIPKEGLRPAQVQPQATILLEQQETERLPAPIPEIPGLEPSPTSLALEAHVETPKAKPAAPGFPTKEELLARLESQERQRAQAAKIPAPIPALLATEPSTEVYAGLLARRLRFLAYGLGLLVTALLAVLVVLFLQGVQKQQTEAELEEYNYSLATAKNTFKSANKELRLAESDLALKESSIQELAKKTREKEAEAEAAKEESLRMAGEQTNYESRIAQLDREKAQTESRLAQWSGLLNDLTNQIADLSRQKQALQASNRSKVITVTNRVTVTNFVEKPRPEPVVTSPTPGTNQAEEAAAMESLPVKLPAAATSSRRQVDVVSTNGVCLYSEDGIKFHQLRARDVLFEGAVIRTGPASWSDLFIRRTGTTVRLAPESQIKFAKLSEASENGVVVMDTLLELSRGRIFTVARALAPGSTFEISDAEGHSVIEEGGLGSYMITAPTNSGDKLALTPLRVINQIGTSIIVPGQPYNAKNGAALSLVPSSWETTLIQLDELEAETDKAIAEPPRSGPSAQK